MKENVLIVKIGGNVIDNVQKLDRFLADFATIEGRKILVHGGGKIATTIGERLGITAKYINGRRVTDEETLLLVTMVYGGLVNKNMVAALQKINCNAVGLTGADGNLMQATRRPVKDVDYGYAGDVNDEGVNHVLLNMLLDNGLVPIIAPLTHNRNGNILNTNADTIAQEIARALARTMRVKLLYCFEQKGILRNIDDEHSIIPHIDSAMIDELKATGVISGGMIPKLENAVKAIRQHVATVAIGHADDLLKLIDGNAGTQITDTK